MSGRKLFILTIVLIVLGLGAYLSQQGTGPKGDTGAQPGDKIFADLDLNAIRQITVASADATNVLKRKDNRWVAANLYDYPADFDKLRGQLTTLPDIKIGQLVRGDKDMLHEFGLGDAASTVTFAGVDGAELAALSIGETRTRQAPEMAAYGGGFPDGQYIRVGDGPVALVTQNLSAWSTDPSAWIQKKLLQVTSSDIVAITVAITGGTYTVNFPNGGTGTLPDLAEGQTMNAGNAGRLQRALNYLNCDSVADPSRTDTGLDAPTTYTAIAKNGLVYQVDLGEAAGNSRYARLSVSFDQPATPTQEDAAALVPEEAENETPLEERIQQKLDELVTAHTSQLEAAKQQVDEFAHLKDWTYLLPSYAAGSMSLDRAELVEEPKAEETPTAETPPAAPASVTTEPVSVTIPPAPPE